MKYKRVNIDDAIFTAPFCCNLEICRGACCTIKGTLGAPSDFGEVRIIEKILPEIEPYLEQEKLNEIIQKGFYEKYGERIYLNTLHGNDCVFSRIENGIAKCAIEKAFIEGKIDFKKPVSCELFPVRYNKETNSIRYERIAECESAIAFGRLNNITVAEFVRNALNRVFGEYFYEGMKNSRKNNNV
jgi:hypothetical protein